MPGYYRDPRLKSAARKRLRARVRAERITRCQHPRCRWPGIPIDYNAPAHTRYAYDLDEIVPIVRGGNPLDRANVRPTHASCNRAEGARITNARLRRQPRSTTPAPRANGPTLVDDDW